MHNYFLKKYYFINKFDTNSINKQDKKTTIIFRNYNLKNKTSIVLNLKKYCKKKGLKFILANDIKLALKLDLDGIYLPSFNKSFNHLSFKLKKKFLIIGSAHNLKELKIKELQKVNIIFISSLFKKNKNYLGINKFKNLINLTNLNIVALGGINKFNRKKLKLINCIGFAGISYFR